MSLLGRFFFFLSDILVFNWGTRWACLLPALWLFFFYRMPPSLSDQGWFFFCLLYSHWLHLWLPFCSSTAATWISIIIAWLSVCTWIRVFNFIIWSSYFGMYFMVVVFLLFAKDNSWLSGLVSFEWYLTPSRIDRPQNFYVRLFLLHLSEISSWAAFLQSSAKQVSVTAGGSSLHCPSLSSSSSDFKLASSQNFFCAVNR